jgi:hypothetical protein
MHVRLPAQGVADPEGLNRPLPASQAKSSSTGRYRCLGPAKRMTKQPARVPQAQLTRQSTAPVAPEQASVRTDRRCGRRPSMIAP